MHQITHKENFVPGAENRHARVASEAVQELRFHMEFVWSERLSGFDTLSLCSLDKFDQFARVHVGVYLEEHCHEIIMFLLRPLPFILHNHGRPRRLSWICYGRYELGLFRYTPRVHIPYLLTHIGANSIPESNFRHMN